MLKLLLLIAALVLPTNVGTECKAEIHNDIGQGPSEFSLRWFGTSTECCPNLALWAMNNSGDAYNMRVLSANGVDGPGLVLDGEGIIFYLTLQCPDEYSNVVIQILTGDPPFAPTWQTVWSGKVACTPTECP